MLELELRNATVLLYTLCENLLNSTTVSPPDRLGARVRRTHLPGLFATPLVNLPVFVVFVWSIRGMLRDASVPGLDTGETLNTPCRFFEPVRYSGAGISRFVEAGPTQ